MSMTYMDIKDGKKVITIFIKIKFFYECKIIEQAYTQRHQIVPFSLSNFQNKKEIKMNKKM